MKRIFIMLGILAAVASCSVVKPLKDNVQGAVQNVHGAIMDAQDAVQDKVQDAKQKKSAFYAVTVPFSVAHRGCHIDGLIPENSVAGVQMAAKYGFRAIECDVHYTKDKKMILMHDGTINRTMRNASDYSEITEKVRYKDLNYDDLRKNYVLASSDPSLRVPITSFEEELLACKKYDIIPMLHSDLPEAYKCAHEVLGDNFVAFDVNYDSLKRARDYSSSCLILWDPGTKTAEEVIPMLQALGGRCGVSSMNDKLLTPEYIAAIRAAGFEVQSSIFPSPKEMQCVADGASIVLSDFSLFAVRNGYEAATLAPVEQPVNLKTNVGSRNLSNYSLEEGKILDDSYSIAVKYGSIETCIRYTGQVELIVNGTMHYVLPEGKNIARVGGWRFYNLAPSIQVRALKDSKFSMQTTVYEY